MENYLNLRIPDIDFSSNLVELIINLEALKSQYKLAPHSPAFLQLREIFSMLESIQSARIEGNRTTVADYTENRYGNDRSSSDRINEINNIESAISYVNECYQDPDFKLNHYFLKELHNIVTSGLRREGSNERGAYRHCNVIISESSHTPPDAILVQNYMENLVDWINEDAKSQHLALKVAIAHHIFTWIHPFDNGNGRMSRVLTYAMLKQYGFDMVYLLNPSAVFCIDRNTYFQKLQIADQRTNDAYIEWCEYVLEGLNNEMKKIIKLLNKDYLNNKIILPAINKVQIPSEYKLILELSLNKDNGKIKQIDIQQIMPDLTSRQINNITYKMLRADYLSKESPRGRIYHINLMQYDILKNILSNLKQEKLIVNN